MGGTKILYCDVECAQQPRPHSPTGEIAGINGQNSEGMCQGGKPGTGKLYTMLLRPHQWVRGRWPWGYGSVLSTINITAETCIPWILETS